MAKQSKMINIAQRRAQRRAKAATRRRELRDLIEFINAHGGKLAPFRGYGAARRLAPTQPAADTTEQPKP